MVGSQEISKRVANSKEAKSPERPPSNRRALRHRFTLFVQESRVGGKLPGSSTRISNRVHNKRHSGSVSKARPIVIHTNCLIISEIKGSGEAKLAKKGGPQKARQERRILLITNDIPASVSETNPT